MNSTQMMHNTEEMGNMSLDFQDAQEMRFNQEKRDTVFEKGHIGKKFPQADNESDDEDDFISGLGNPEKKVENFGDTTIMESGMKSKNFVY